MLMVTHSKYVPPQIQVNKREWNLFWVNGMVFGHKGKKASLGVLSVLKYKFEINNENYHSFVKY